MGALIADLKRDNRFGGSLEGYNRMLRSMQELREDLLSFNGPLMGRRRESGFVKGTDAGNAEPCQ